MMQEQPDSVNQMIAQFVKGRTFWIDYKILILWVRGYGSKYTGK